MKLFITNYKEIFEIDESVLPNVSAAYISLTGFYKIEKEKTYTKGLSEKLNIKNPKFIIDVDYFDCTNNEFHIFNKQYIMLLNNINQLIYQIRQDKLNSLIK